MPRPCVTDLIRFWSQISPSKNRWQPNLIGAPKLCHRTNSICSILIESGHRSSSVWKNPTERMAHKIVRNKYPYTYILKSPTVSILRLLKSVRNLICDLGKWKTLYSVLSLFWSSLAKTDLSTVSRPSCFSSTRILRIKRLSNFSMCCLKQLHPRVAHNPEFLGTRTDVSLNCPGGTGWLCGSRYALTDLLFQTLCEVSIARENHTPSSNTWQRMATTVNACKYLIGCQCPLPAAPWLLAVCFLWLWGSVQTKHQESPDSSRAGMSQHCKTHSHKEWSDETLDQWDLLWLNQKRTGLKFQWIQWSQQCGVEVQVQLAQTQICELKTTQCPVNEQLWSELAATNKRQ